MKSLLSAALTLALVGAAHAEAVTLGMILPLTGPSASTGKQEKAGAELYLALHGATEAKAPEIVTAAATAVVTEKSPFIVRTSFTLPQACAPMAEWAAKNGVKKVVTIVSDYGPGLDAEK